ncbi:MAG: hypothetical protein ACPGWR_08870 [Ardenticatenaceae bacterium]
MKKITAKLDLEEAIKLFREEVQEALKIDEVSDWDGRLLLMREMQIAHRHACVPQPLYDWQVSVLPSCYIYYPYLKKPMHKQVNVLGICDMLVAKGMANDLSK